MGSVKRITGVMKMSTQHVSVCVCYVCVPRLCADCFVYGGDARVRFFLPRLSSTAIWGGIGYDTQRHWEEQYPLALQSFSWWDVFFCYVQELNEATGFGKVDCARAFHSLSF